MRYADRVKETTTTTGTGTIDLAGAASGFQGFVAAGLTGASIPYAIVSGSDWEVGLGTVTDAATDTLARDTILASSNAGSAISLSGTSDVYNTLPAEVLQSGLLREESIDSTGVTDQGTYHDFDAELNTFYWVDVNDVITDLDDHNIRVNAPGSPAVGDCFGWGVKVQATQAGNFANAPGYCVDLADSTANVFGETYDAESVDTGGGKLSCWVDAEFVVLRWNGADWVLWIDGRVPQNIDCKVTTACTSNTANTPTSVGGGGSAGAWTVEEDPVGCFDNTTGYQYEAKRGNTARLVGGIFSPYAAAPGTNPALRLNVTDAQYYWLSGLANSEYNTAHGMRMNVLTADQKAEFQFQTSAANGGCRHDRSKFQVIEIFDRQ